MLSYAWELQKSIMALPNICTASSDLNEFSISFVEFAIFALFHVTGVVSLVDFICHPKLFFASMTSTKSYVLSTSAFLIYAKIHSNIEPGIVFSEKGNLI